MEGYPVISPHIKKNAPDVEVGMTVLQFDIGITKGDHVLTMHK